MSDWTPPSGPADDFAREAVPIIRVTWRDGAKYGIEDNDLGIDFDWADPKAIEYAERRGAELVGRRRDASGNLIANPAAKWVIDETTRETVNDLVTQAVSEGWSISTFARELEATGVFESSRAETIARTELAYAMNGGRLASYREADVELVVVQDADECGEDICDVDGEVWTIDEAEAEPLGHVNCTRSFRPATRDEVAEENAAEEEAAA